MNATHGLTEKTISQIVEVLEHFPELNEALLFGSRAKRTHKPGSDIDLALVGNDLDWRITGKIYDHLDDLLLPYRFSLTKYDASTDPDVAAHIARVGILLFQRERFETALAGR